MDAGPADAERVREICLRALERRMHGRRELELKLRQKGVDPGTAAVVLDRLTEVGLVDDEAFARALVASRQRGRPRGRRGLEAELRQKGVSAEIADRVLDELAETEDPVATARRAVAAKVRSLAGRPPAEVRRKAEQFLVRRGFSFGTARAALDEILPAAGEEES